MARGPERNGDEHPRREPRFGNATRRARRATRGRKGGAYPWIGESEESNGVYEEETREWGADFE